MKWLAVLGCASSIARAEPPPVVIAPFKTRCFDAAQLAERVRLSVPELPVRVGAGQAGAHQLVRVSPDGADLTVQVTARNAAGKLVGSERRTVPGTDDCPTLLDTAALIVARAATPLHALKPVAPKPSPPKPTRPEHAVERPERAERPEPPPSPPSPSPASPAPSPSSPEPAPSPSPAAAPTPAPPTPAPSPAPPSPPPATSPPTARPQPEARAAPAAHVSTLSLPNVPPRRHAEIELAAAWAFQLDNPPSTPSGELHVGYAWPRAGLILRAGVDGDWTRTVQSTAGPIMLDVRRLPLGLEAHLDVRVRGGAFRFSLGPNLALNLVRAEGVPRSSLRTVLEPGVTARIAYRLELGRVVLSAGVVLDAQFISDELSVGGVGNIAKTPFVQISPYVSAGTLIF